MNPLYCKILGTPIAGAVWFLYYGDVCQYEEICGILTSTIQINRPTNRYISSASVSTHLTTLECGLCCILVLQLTVCDAYLLVSRTISQLYYFVIKNPGKER